MQRKRWLSLLSSLFSFFSHCWTPLLWCATPRRRSSILGEQKFLMVSAQNEQITTHHHKSYSKSWTTSLLDDMWLNTEGRSRSLTVFPPPLHCLISITKTDCVSFLRQKWTFYKFNRFKSMHIIQRTTEENNMRRGDENRTDNFRKSARTRYYQRRWWWDRKRDEWEQLSRTFYSMKKGRVKRIHWNPR